MAKIIVRKRIDRFIEDAFGRFAEWLVEVNWIAKERDVVNIFAAKFLMPAVHPDAAISSYSQVRIETGIPQPKGFVKAGAYKPGAYKDMAIWRGELEIAHDSDGRPTTPPWVVIEWKVRRKGSYPDDFDAHDQKWLKAFTKQNQKSFGYAITVDFRAGARTVRWRRFRHGKLAKSR